MGLITSDSEASAAVSAPAAWQTPPADRRTRTARHRANALEIGFQFFQQLVTGRHRHHRHIIIHQRQGAVSLSSPAGFGAAWGNLLQLQRPSIAIG